MAIFKKNGNSVNTDIEKIYQCVESIHAGSSNEVRKSDFVDSLKTSLESIDNGGNYNDMGYNKLQDNIKILTASLEQMTGSISNTIKGVNYSEAQREAATAAYLMASSPRDYFKAHASLLKKSTEGYALLSAADRVDGLNPAIEAFDERDNKNVIANSITYNLQAARQDDFAEAFFPTIVVSPDQIGISTTIRLSQVQNDFKRNISGAADDYNKQNILRAYVNPEILKNQQTRIIPVWREESKERFVDAAVIAPSFYDLEGESIKTSPLKASIEIGSLLGLSQTDTLVASGLMNTGDSIDPAVVLEEIYIKIGADIVSFKVDNLPLSTFVNPTQGMDRQMTLNFLTDSLVLSKNTKTIAASPLTEAALTKIINDKLLVRVKIQISGNLNVETSNISVGSPMPLSCSVIRTETGEVVAMDAGDGKAIADLLSDTTKTSLIGYKVKAYRSNINKRQRGQLIVSNSFTQQYVVPLKGPVTAVKPVGQDGQSDTADLASLITYTHIATSNAAVARLIETDALLASQENVNDLANLPIQIGGMSRYLLEKPAYFAESIDCAVDVDSLTSNERITDLKATIVNKIRDMAYRLYTTSAYQVGYQAYNGGVSKKPTVIIGTDPYIAQYLMIDGDLRTIGPDFEMKIVSTYNKNMRGRLFITFGDFTKTNEYNPFHFGFHAWKPELTVVLPMTRDGAIAKELTVQPSFEHITNLPILGSLKIDNIETIVASKVALNVNTV